MFKLLKSVFSVGLCATLLLVTAPSQAALVAYTFSGTIDSGLLTGETYNGEIAFNNDTLTNSGSEYLPLSMLSFNFLATAFNLADADFTATADFFNGVFLGISYTVSSFEPTFSLISALGTGLPDDVAYLSYHTITGDSGFGSLQFVDEPASVALLVMGLASIGLMRRRAKKPM